MASLPLLLLGCLPAVAAPPIDNPAARYQLAWVDALPWDRTLNIQEVEGATFEQRLETAQKQLTLHGGGVVFFPAGIYTFQRSLKLYDGIVWRGEAPKGVTDARKDGYQLPTQFRFPKYQPRLSGQGTPIDTAFRGITLADPAQASNCGLVYLAIDHGHVDLGSGPDEAAGKQRLVYGCLLTHAAVADRNVPDQQLGQHPWQRFTDRHHAAITVDTAKNCLVANNRLPRSGQANFTMHRYLVKGRGKQARVELPEVVFDYDNRPGLYINNAALGGSGGNPPDGTPQTHPYAFRKGIVICDNYLYMTGRCAISFSGDGTICANNVIRFAKDVYRPTTTGRNLTSGSSTNDNRAVQMRGWRWTVQGNDYEVFRNWAADRSYKINDGEGLMHEDHVNSTVRDSKLLNNRGNTYISIYKTGGIDGLEIRGNTIRTQGGIAAIYVEADRNRSRHPCQEVRIIGNTTTGSGIHIAGEPARDNVVQDNHHQGPGGILTNQANARLHNNRGYTIEN